MFTVVVVFANVDDYVEDSIQNIEYVVFPGTSQLMHCHGNSIKEKKKKSEVKHERKYKVSRAASQQLISLHL